MLSGVDRNNAWTGTGTRTQPGARGLGNSLYRVSLERRKQLLTAVKTNKGNIKFAINVMIILQWRITPLYYIRLDQYTIWNAESPFVSAGSTLVASAVLAN